MVDLSDVESIDSSGIGMLVELRHRLRRRERQLAVVAPGGTAAALILNLSGLRNRLPTYETRQAATAHTLLVHTESMRRACEVDRAFRSGHPH